MQPDIQPQDIAIFGGTVVIINAQDAEFEASTLTKLLQKNSIELTSMQDVARVDIPGRPYMRTWEDIAMQARLFLVIPSQGLQQDNKLRELIYIAMGSEKRVIPVKFSGEDSGMPFLENLSWVSLYTDAEGAQKEAHIRFQIARLLEALQ